MFHQRFRRKQLILWQITEVDFLRVRQALYR
jgi:hypothetical protein